MHSGVPVDQRLQRVGRFPVGGTVTRPGLLFYCITRVGEGETGSNELVVIGTGDEQSAVTGVRVNSPVLLDALDRTAHDR